MGAVFTAEQISLHTLVAVKMIHAVYTENVEISERFRREAMATAKIDHPNVTRAIDFGRLPNGGAYLVTQLVRGPTLTQTIAAGKLPWRKACDIGFQIADALVAAHGAGIIHRDLKPDNILLERREETSVVKVLDFGLARLADGGPGATPLTRLGTVMGTPGYMAPEQGAGEPTDERTDLYALGVVLWECLAGRELWDGGELSDIMLRQLSQPPPSLVAEIPDLPPEFDRLLGKLLAREARDRPQTAREVREALRALANSPAPTVVAPTPTSTPKPTPAPKSPSSPPNRGLAGFLAVFAGLALLVIVLWAVKHSGSGGEGPAPAPPSKTATK